MKLVRAQGQRTSLLVREDKQVLLRTLKLNRRLQLLRGQGVFAASPGHIRQNPAKIAEQAGGGLRLFFVSVADVPRGQIFGWVAGRVAQIEPRVMNQARGANRRTEFACFLL